MNWNNYIWLIGGGQLQRPVALEIKNQGYDLLITDRNNKYNCRDLADSFKRIDTYSLEKNSNFIERLLQENHKPKAILTDAADIGITVSTVCEIAQLPCTPLHNAIIINNKLELRKIISSNSYPIWINATKLYCTEAWVKWIKKCSDFDIPIFPCIFKPVDSCASRGVYKINNLEEFENYFYKIAPENKYAEDGEFIIEQCLTGNEFASDWFVRNGVPEYVNGAKRVFSSQFGIELGHINPWFPIPEKVQQLAQNLCAKVGYNYGPLKIDFINDPKIGWCILEAATRWSGGYDHGFTAKISTDRNLEKPLLDFALGKPVTIPKIDKVFSSAAIGFCYDNHKITPEKLEILQNVYGFVDIFYNKNEVFLGYDIEHNAQRNVFITTYGENDDEAWMTALNCKEIIESSLREQPAILDKPQLIISRVKIGNAQDWQDAEIYKF